MGSDVCFKEGEALGDCSGLDLALVGMVEVDHPDYLKLIVLNLSHWINNQLGACCMILNDRSMMMMNPHWCKYWSES